MIELPSPVSVRETACIVLAAAEGASDGVPALHKGQVLVEMHFDLVRTGIATYGLNPGPAIPAATYGLTPAMTLRTHVALTKRVPPGSNCVACSGLRIPLLLAAGNPTASTGSAFRFSPVML